MRCWKSVRDRLVAVAVALVVGAAAAAGIEIRSAGVVPGDEAYYLEAEVDLALNATLEDVVSRGVALYFVLEFEITRPRWYWFDEKVASRNQTYRLSFNALTRQYRLSTGALHQNFNTLDEAVRVMSRLRQWPVAERGQLAPGESYDAALRLRLDLAQLPKPIQVSAIGAREWTLNSDWLHWRFSLAPPSAK